MIYIETSCRYCPGPCFQELGGVLFLSWGKGWDKYRECIIKSSKKYHKIIQKSANMILLRNLPWFSYGIHDQYDRDSLAAPCSDETPRVCETRKHLTEAETLVRPPCSWNNLRIGERWDFGNCEWNVGFAWFCMGTRRKIMENPPKFDMNVDGETKMVPSDINWG